MPGEETPPNLNFANAFAYDADFLPGIDFFLDQFPVEDSTDKVQKFCNVPLGINVSVRYDNTLFPE